MTATTTAPPAPSRFRLLSSSTVPLTPELAAEHKAMQASPTERDLDKSRVEFLRERLFAGTFHTPHWVRVVIEGQRYRANGNHSANMLAALNGHFPEGMFVHIDEFDCPDLDSLALLFRQFDARKSARSPADVAGAYQGLQSALDCVPKHIAKHGAEAVAWFRDEVLGDDDVPGGDDRYQAFNEAGLHPYLRWLGEVFPAGKIPKGMGKSPIFAAMFGTFDHDPDVADDFWRDVARGGREYEDGHPTTQLAEWFKRLHDGEMKVPPKGIYQGCIYTWNAVREGKTTMGEPRANIRRNLLRIA